MNFSSADRVESVINNMQSAETFRAPQRALLNDFFNGARPWTDDEAKRNKILINFNDKSGVVVLQQARGQFENAFLKSGVFFNVEIDCPPDKQQEWSAIVTKEINRIMKKSRAFNFVMRSKFAGVVLHGVGAQVWWDDDKWAPASTAIQDLLIPTDTELTLDNLRYFSVRRKMRPGELFKLTYGKGDNRRPGWNMKLVTKILDQYKELNENPHTYDWANNPEAMTELYKQNLTFYDSDSAPVIWVQDFFFREEGDGDLKPGWYRRLMLDKDNTYVSQMKDDEGHSQFIYAPKRPYADSVDQIIHFQFGDGNNVPPFMYHSIRSLAYLLYELMWTMNRLNCQFTQHVFEQLMTWFRVQDPSDRSRLDNILISPPFAIIPEGLNVFRRDERYAVDANLITLLQQQYRQKIGESSASYTQKLDSGQQQERTAREVEALMSQINQLMSSMLTLAYGQEFFAYQEIARRFCIKNSHDFDVKKFRSACIRKGVDAAYLNIDKWTLKVEQVLGAGNKMMELAEARELRGMRPTLNPNAQMTVDRMYITALTSNPGLAESLVPHAPTISDSIHDAELAFGTLMQGVEVQPKEGLNPTEQIQTVLRLMAQVVQRIAATDKVGTPQDVIGLNTCSIYVAKQIGMLAQNPDNKALVKEFGDALGKLRNEIKAMQQRQMEARAAQGQNQTPDPKAAGEAASLRVKLAGKAASDQQKLIHKQQSFEADQKRKDALTVADIRRKTGLALADAHVNGIRSRKSSIMDEE